MLAKSMLIRGLIPPTKVEALGCKEVISWLQQLQYHRAIIELDSILVVEGIRKDCTTQK